MRDAASLDALFAARGAELRAVWNLVAPLSVETASDPGAAEDVTVGGMRRVIAAMERADVRARLCFSDSIGSFGASAPRDAATAAWLVANPEQVRRERSLSP